MLTPSGLNVPANTALVTVPGREASWFAAVFGPSQADAHVKAWQRHAYRLSDNGRALMRARLAQRYPGLDPVAALALYRSTTESYMDERYV